MLEKGNAAVLEQRGRIGSRLSRGRHGRGLRIRQWPESAAFLARSMSSLSFRAMNCGRSIKSSGKYPHRHSSENTAKSAPRTLGGVRELQNLRGISSEVADSGINLRERDLHKSSIGYGARLWFAMSGIAAKAFPGIKEKEPPQSIREGPFRNTFVKSGETAARS